MKFLKMAIDPGVGGSVSIILPDKVNTVTTVTPTNKTGEICKLIKAWKKWAEDRGYKLVVYIERVTGFIGTAQPGSAMFTFGGAFEYPFGVCDALDVNIRTVEPREWQEAVGVSELVEKWKDGKGIPEGLNLLKNRGKKNEKFDSYRARKQAALFIGRKLFPKLVVTEKMGDSLLIAYYVSLETA